MDTSAREPEPIPGTIPVGADAPTAPLPPAASVEPVRSPRWEWGREDDRRPKLPWIGIFLIIYGALLLVQRLYPTYLTTSNLVVLAAGLAFLVAWLIRSGTFSLYAGAFLIASSVPGLVEGLGYTFGPGFGTLCYGVALLFIALVRTTRNGGIGWQAVIGVLLTALGGSQMTMPDASSLILPILLVVTGIVLLTRDRGQRNRGSWDTGPVDDPARRRFWRS